MTHQSHDKSWERNKSNWWSFMALIVFLQMEETSFVLPLIITLSRAPALEEQKFPHHPRPVLLCSLYSKNSWVNYVGPRPGSLEHLQVGACTHTVTWLFSSGWSHALSFSSTHTHTHPLILKWHNLNLNRSVQYCAPLSKVHHPLVRTSSGLL